MIDTVVLNDAVTSLPRKESCLNDIPADVRLPQLSTILDHAVMRDILQQRMFLSSQQTQFVIRRCQIVQIRYKPASSCMVSYRLDIEDTATGDSGEQILCGRAYPDGCSQSQWEKASTRRLVAPRFGSPRIHLPELEMVLWSFPNDRKMHALPASITASPSISELGLHRILSQTGIEWQLVKGIADVVHYVGEHTCTVRTSMELRGSSQDTTQMISVFGKTYYDGEGARTDQVMRKLWDSEARKSGRLGLAQPLWYDGPRKTLWQLGIEGATLENHPIGTSGSVEVLIQSARAIAALHGTPLLNIESIRITNLLEKLDIVGSMLLQHRPSCRPVLAPLLARLTAQIRTLPLCPTATLHGDLHLKNLFSADGRIYLIDLDNVREGPPEWDIGSFVAGLVVGGLSTQVPNSDIADNVQIFLDHYNQSALWTVAMPTVAWCTAVALVIERAYRCVTRLKGDQLGQLERLLRWSDRISQTLSLEALDFKGTSTQQRNEES